MTTQLKKKSNVRIMAGRVGNCLFRCDRRERVMRALDLCMHEAVSQRRPIEEQLQTMPRSLQSRRVARKSIELAQVRPRRSVAKRTLATSGRRDHPSHRLIGLPLAHDDSQHQEYSLALLHSHG